MSGGDKVSNLIAERVKHEVDTVFGVTGGCIVNLVDSFYKKGLRIVSMHHEQSAAIAADSYARFKGFGVCYGTSGPGTTNLTTGTACSYYDSIPVLTFGGQVPSQYLNHGRDRQFGFQETDGVNLMKPITKFSKRMTSMSDLEEAIRVAKDRRQGPTFLELCDDYQRTTDYPPFAMDTKKSANFSSEYLVPQLIINQAEKPLVIVGSGARNMDLELDIPFLYTWGVKDKYFNHPSCKGDFGITGSPNGNRLTRESDLIVMIGTKMDTHQVPKWEDFAPQAYKISMGLEFPHKVDHKIDMPLDFKLRLKGRDWGTREENNTNTPIYKWIDRLCDESDKNDIIIPDMGQTGCIAFQRWKPKEGQRLFNAFGHSPMGYALPASIGASIATGRRTKVIVGDGSLMMNLHDLQTIGDLGLPVDIYVVKNNGYGMIRQTQADWPEFLEQEVACNFRTPKAKDLAKMFNVNIQEVNFKDTRISPKWKYGTKL